MDTLINAIRSIIGKADFYIGSELSYSAMFEYFVASVILVIVVSSVFKILVRVFSR